jgi:dolichyl-diphosphooligosaccharide--protein glycosyltransferase
MRLIGNSAWGGYTFVLNMIGLHVAILIGLGRYTTKLHRAYSVFFAVATAVVMQIPIVGTKPIQDMEQVAPLLVFFGIQVRVVVQLLQLVWRWDIVTTHNPPSE